MYLLTASLDTVSPRLVGADYSCALEKVQGILSTDTSNFCFLVFLSDGRPGDLPHTLPPIGSEKNTYTVNGEVRPSATSRIVSIAKKLKKKLFLNTVCMFRFLVASYSLIRILSHPYGSRP